MGTLATSWTTTIQLSGAIAGAVIVILAGLFTIRGKNAEWWQQSYHGVKAAYDEEKGRAAQLAADKVALTARVAALESKPDYESLQVMMVDLKDSNAANIREVVVAVENLTSVIEKRLPDIEGHRHRPTIGG